MTRCHTFWSIFLDYLSVQLCGMQVWLPWAAAVYGEVQHQLLMAVLLENMAEASAFAQSPQSTVGQRLPPLPPQPAHLEVDCNVRHLFMPDFGPLCSIECSLCFLASCYQASA